MADIGKSASTNKKNSLLGGLFGGGAFLIAVMILNFGLLANIKVVANLEIPSLYVADSISPVFGAVFSVLLLLGIYTTAVPMMYTVCNKISSDSHSKVRSQHSQFGLIHFFYFFQIINRTFKR